MIQLTGTYITITSPQKLLMWASRKIFNKIFIGVVLTNKTINYKTGLPILGGLFCEKIFGPIKNWKCFCQKTYSKKTIWSFCGEEINSSIIRKYRMGCVYLNTPFYHPWYIKTQTSILPIILNYSKNTFLHIVYYNNCFKLKKFQNLLELKKIFFSNIYYKFYLEHFNILEEIIYIKEKLLLNLNSKNFFYKKIIILNLFYTMKLNLSWLMLEILPILPPKIRPILKINSTSFVTSILNESYKNIITHNNKLIHFFKLKTIPLMEINEKIMLQKSLDILFIPQKINPPLSLPYTLLGKSGRFRQNLLGKRIDFSGRSVISVGPDLIFNKIGIPILLAYNLFKPLIKTILNKNIFLKNILKFCNIDYTILIIKKLLIKLLKYNVLLINRAPTLHRMNIQAFQPYLIEDFSVKLYPLAWSGFNADFDGDQISIFLTLTKSSRLESKNILLSDKNLFSPMSGKLIYKLNQTMILGLSIINLLKPCLVDSHYFSNIFYGLDFYYQKLINIQQGYWIRFFCIDKKFKYNTYFIFITPGRLLINLIANLNNEYY